MMTVNTGWALKTQGLSLLVFHTDDGGLHWKNVTPVHYLIAWTYRDFEDPQPFINAFFLDENTAWVLGSRSPNATIAGDTVLHTVNAGHTWNATPLPIPSDYSPIPNNNFIDTNITFVNPLNGWLLLHLTAGTIPDTVALLRTTDGGKTWTKVYDDGMVPPFQVPSQTKPGGFLLYANQDETMPLFKGGLSFRNTANGWVPDAGGRHGLLYVTYDGGHTWQEQPLRPPSSLNFTFTTPFVPTFFTSTDGILPVSYYPGGLVIYVTHDGGTSWIGTTPVNAFANGIMAGNFIDVHHGWTTDGRFLYATSDSGQTWTTIAPDVSFAHLFQLDFVSATTGWVIIGPYAGGSELLKTTDGGHTWVSADIPDPQ